MDHGEDRISKWLCLVRPAGLSAAAMSTTRKALIARAFDRAEDYDAHAHIQRSAAEYLAARIAGLGIDPSRPALEIGCGTGFLTEALVTRWPSLSLTASDVAPAMIERTRSRIGDTIAYAIIDGEDPGGIADSGYGLIASNLAFQWFADLGSTLSRLTACLAPGGWLVFSTLAAGTFREWTKAQTAAGIIGLTRTYPDLGMIEAMTPAGTRIDVSGYLLKEQHASGRDFLRGLKAIGAATAWDRSGAPGTAPLRKAIKTFEDGGATISYKIAEVAIQRPR
jgi:malonyl-CoA O-methyltransferase